MININIWNNAYGKIRFKCNDLLIHFNCGLISDMVRYHDAFKDHKHNY